MPPPEDYPLLSGLSSQPQDENDEGFFNRLMKGIVRFNSASSVEVRKKQIAQYLGDDPSALPDTKLRPTSLTKFQDQPFKSQYKYLPRLIQMPKDMVGKNINELKLPYKFDQYNQPTVALGSDYGGIANYNLASYSGLGNGTISIGKNEKGKPYLSQFDSWDFDDSPGTGQINPTAFKIVKKLGRPFNVYDRIPIQGNTIPEYVDPFTRGDIELPDPRRR